MFLIDLRRLGWVWVEFGDRLCLGSGGEFFCCWLGCGREVVCWEGYLRNWEGKILFFVFRLCSEYWVGLLAWIYN